MLDGWYRSFSRPSLPREVNPAAYDISPHACLLNQIVKTAASCWVSLDKCRIDDPPQRIEQFLSGETILGAIHDRHASLLGVFRDQFDIRQFHRTLMRNGQHRRHLVRKYPEY